MTKNDSKDPRSMNKQAPGKARPADGRSHLVGKCSSFVRTIFFIDDDRQKSWWNNQLADNGHSESEISACATLSKNTKEIFVIG